MVVHGATAAMDAWVPGNGVLGGGGGMMGVGGRAGQGMRWLVGRYVDK
jgi:hypothetical protein